MFDEDRCAYLRIRQVRRSVLHRRLPGTVDHARELYDITQLYRLNCSTCVVKGRAYECNGKKVKVKRPTKVYSVYACSDADGVTESPRSHACADVDPGQDLTGIGLTLLEEVGEGVIGLGRS